MKLEDEGVERVESLILDPKSNNLILIKREAEPVNVEKLLE